MFETEFSHEGDCCTFEVLRRRLALEHPGLSALAEVIQDIDLRDAKFARSETDGVAAMIAEIALRYRDDEARLAHGSDLCEHLLAYFARKTTERSPTNVPTAKSEQEMTFSATLAGYMQRDLVERRRWSRSSSSSVACLAWSSFRSGVEAQSRPFA
jgi:hypothetical protein